jgi:hypothetical protein
MIHLCTHLDLDLVPHKHIGAEEKPLIHWWDD